MIIRLLVPLLLILSITAASAAPAPKDRRLEADAINTARFDSDAGRKRALVTKSEVLLDRADFSPGVIDGREGDNFRKAVAAFQNRHNLEGSGKLDRATFEMLASLSSEPVITDYEISQKDVEGPFEKRIPASFEAMAHLARLSYRDPRQELAERFHMSESLLTELNPGIDFRHSGVRIKVANPDRQSSTKKIAKIVIDKPGHTLSAFDASGELLAFYPASIGSKEKPAPSGEFKVAGVSRNPTYTYNPKFAFKGVKAKHKFTIKPGPNNPVGLVWIDLTAPSYGIHGTPSPENVGKTESHGCIRLTNWDALDLAAMVIRGTIVDFQG